MAKSSIHIEAGNPGFLFHNDRSRATVNSIFDDEENEVWNSAKEGFKIYRLELKARSDAYSRRTKQKLQKKTITHLSAIINFNQNHTMADMKKVANYLENELGTKVLQIAMHRDEGHYDQHGKAVKNYHAHIEFMGLDQDGYSVRKKLTKSMLSQMQTDIAELLNMERGINYIKKQYPRPKRLDTYEFKAHKKKEAMAVKALKKELVQELDKAHQNISIAVQTERESQYAKLKDLKKENLTLRNLLKEQKAGREDYSKLEALNKELKEQVKAKNLSIDELQTRFMDLEKELISKNEEKEEEQKANIELNTYAGELEKKLISKNEEIKHQSKQIEELRRQGEELQKLFEEFNGLIKRDFGEYKKIYYENELPSIQEMLELGIKSELESLKDIKTDKEIEKQETGEQERQYYIPTAPSPWM